MEKFSPENELEKRLVAAATDPAEVPAFLDILLTSNIYIVPVGEKPSIENGMLKKDSTISIQQVTGGDIWFTAFYSSPNRLPQGTEYIQFMAKDFLELTRGSYLALNPGLDYGKEFYPNEIDSILSGGHKKSLTRRIVQKGTSIIVGQPKEYPQDLVEALRRFFTKHSNVKEAYLVQYYDPSSTENEPGLLIGVEIDFNDDFDSLSAEIGTIIRTITIPQAYADVMKINKGDQVFKNTKPFYQRDKKHSWLKRLFR